VDGTVSVLFRSSTRQLKLKNRRESRHDPPARKARAMARNERGPHITRFGQRPGGGFVLEGAIAVKGKLVEQLRGRRGLGVAPRD
jgi:hypothetical protein